MNNSIAWMLNSFSVMPSIMFYPSFTPDIPDFRAEAVTFISQVFLIFHYVFA